MSTKESKKIATATTKWSQAATTRRSRQGGFKWQRASYLGTNKGGARIRLKILVDEIHSDEGFALRVAAHYCEEGGRPLTHVYTDGECPEIEELRRAYFHACDQLAFAHRRSRYQSEYWFAGLSLCTKDVAAFIDALVAAGIRVEILGVKHLT